MSTPKGFYSISQVAKRTQMSANLIRKWEERYQLLTPKRLDNGFRVYSEQDIHLLLQVKTLIEQGYSVKNAIMALGEHLSAPKPAYPNIASFDETNPDMQSGQPELQLDSAHHIDAQSYLQHLEMAGAICDDQKLSSMLQHVFHIHGISFLMKYIIPPFLIRIGELWESGDWSEHQEHVSSLVVRDYLIKLRSLIAPPKEAPLILGCCLPGERHEIPVHLILIEAMLRQWQTTFLGGSPAPGAIESAVEQIHPQIVIISASTLLPIEEHPDVIPQLDEFAGKHTHIDFVLGGAGASIYAQQHGQLKHIRLAYRVQDVFQGKIQPLQ